MTEKRFYWLKMMDNFFRQKEIKKLRKLAGGDTYTIIYQEMMLLRLENGGKLYFEDFGEDLAEEIALEYNCRLRKFPLINAPLVSKIIKIFSGQSPWQSQPNSGVPLDELP